MTYEEAKLFIRNLKNYEELFSQETLIECLSKQDIKDWTQKKNVDINYYRGQYDKYPQIKDKHLDYVFHEIHEKGLSATACYQTQCYTFLIPCDAQLKEDKFFLDCIHAEMPELKYFNFKCYHLDRLDTLIFLETNLQINGHNASLYIPINKLLDRDIDAIIQKHTEYHKEYYNPIKAGRSWNQTKEQLQEWQDLSLDVLNQPIVKSLFEILKNPNYKCELTIDDFRALMNGGISAMRESIEEREKKKVKIFHVVNDFQKKVKEEYIEFKRIMIKETTKNPDFSFMKNFEIYTKMNLFMFFCDQEPLELWDTLTMVTTGRFEITDEELIQFLQIDYILEILYNFETDYDSECHTDTWNNICFMIEEYIDEYMRD